MADVLRIVRLSPGGRPIEVLNLNSDPGTVTAYFRERGTFQFTPAVSTVQYSKKARRYGGATAVGETHDNGAIGWTAYVRGATLAAAVQNVEALIAQITETARGRFVEWYPEGGIPSYLEIAGPGTWTPAYDPVEFVQTNAMRVQLSFPTMPLVRWAQPTITDPFDVIASITDYTFDAATPADVVVVPDVVTIGNGQINPVVGAALSVERRARHTTRRYTYLEGQTTLRYDVGTTITGQKYGALLRATSATNYVEVYVDDNGVNSRLRIDVVIAGVRTNRATTNLAARMIAGASHTVRARIETGNLVVAEHFIGDLDAVTAPTTTTSYTLVGGDAPLNTIAGYSGWSWVPISSNSELTNFSFSPHTYRALALPLRVNPSDAIPGTAPALVDIQTTVTGGTAPVFALFSWAKRASVISASNSAPFGVFTSTSVHSVVNLTTVADAGALGGASRQDTAVSGVEVYEVRWQFDPANIISDEFSTEELSLELWIRLTASSSVVNPVVVASARAINGTSFGAERFTDEWGSAGRSILGDSFYHLYRLGVVRVPAEAFPLRSPVRICVLMTTGAGSTGAVRFDYLMVVPSKSRVLSPTAKVLDATYPAFIAGTTGTAKLVRADLSARTSTHNNPFWWPDHGLGGNLIEPPPGQVDWFLKLSNQVPDDPTIAVASDSITHTASVQINPTPRSFMLRTA
jgi:hypothetical protein